MATKTKKTLTAAEQRANILDKKKKLEAELLKVDSAEVSEKLVALRLPDLIAKIKEETKTKISDAALLDAIGKAAGLKQFEVTAKEKDGGSKKSGAPRKSYNDAFKEKAVKMVKDGKKKADVCKELDITPSSLTNWIKATEK